MHSQGCVIEKVRLDSPNCSRIAGAIHTTVSMLEKPGMHSQGCVIGKVRLDSPSCIRGAGAIHTIVSMLEKPGMRCAALTMLGKTIEHAHHQVCLSLVHFWA